MKFDVLIRKDSSRRKLEGPYGADLQQLPTGSMFLYLQKKEWAETWINGGTIPFTLASKFRSDLRAGTRTPDEVGQYREDGVSFQALEASKFMKVSGQVRNIRIIGSSFNGVLIPDARLDDYEEDALILSFSHTISVELGRKLENKTCCVEILDFDSVLKALQTQYSGKVCYGPVVYTEGAERSHFLKSLEDSWQDEFRIVLPSPKTSEFSLTIPSVAKMAFSY